MDDLLGGGFDDGVTAAAMGESNGMKVGGPGPSLLWAEKVCLIYEESPVLYDLDFIRT